MTVEERLQTALRTTEPVQALRALVLDLAREGHSKSEIYELFEKFLLQLRTRPDLREEDEDAVLDVMDAITGWCHSSAALLPDMPAR
jgi:hypothetical protein